jgi:hypothetical protein
LAERLGVERIPRNPDRLADADAREVASGDGAIGGIAADSQEAPCLLDGQIRR